jgi:hypothetical protein
VSIKDTKIYNGKSYYIYPVLLIYFFNELVNHLGLFIDDFYIVSWSIDIFTNKN